MSTLTACPEVRVLERLLLGQIPAADAGPLEEHVAACPRCLDTMQHLRADDPLVAALQHTPLPGSEEPTPLIEALIPCLKRLRPNQPSATSSEEMRPAEASALPPHFDFLAPAQTTDELGRLGSYRVLQPLGAGGMGVVFLADDPRLQRRIALKVIKPELVQRPEARARFLREAQAVARVEHDNIVTIFQVDEDRGVPFLAMPLLRGESLQERLHRNPGPLPLDETLRLSREIAAGLAAAHDHGLVHRDIKPGNIFLSLTRRPSPGDESTTLPLGEEKSVAPAASIPGNEPIKVKILDFGLARAVGVDHGDLSQQGQIIGTPAYMAPEQGRGQPVDHRADLFSLGCVLYRLATGRLAFSGDSYVATLMSVAMDSPVPVRQLNPGVPPELVRLIEQLLSKNPEDRPASAHIVIDTIEAIERERAEARRPKPSRRGLLIGTAAAVLFAAGLAAILAWWATRAPVLPPQKPGEVTFEFDEPDAPLALRRGDEDEKAIDPRDGHAYRLAPGWYRIRPTIKLEKRQLVPHGFEVKEGEALKVTLRLVGELRNSGGVHDHPVMCVAAIRKKGDLLVLSASIDGTVGVWKPFAKPPEDTVHFLTGHTSEVHAVAFAPDGNLAASGGGGKIPRTADMSIRLSDVSSAKRVDQLLGHASWVQALAFSPDGKQLLSGARDGSVYLWDVKARTKSEWKAADGHSVTSVAFSADGKRALTGGDKAAILWDVEKGKEVQRLEGHGGLVRGVVFGPGTGEVATACDDGLIRIWDLKGDKVRELKGHTDAVTSLALSPDGKWLLSGSRDGTVRLWNAVTGREECSFETGHAVNSVAFTADGRRAVSGGSDNGIRVWGELPP